MKRFYLFYLLSLVCVLSYAAWDGITTVPITPEADGHTYMISSPEQLAWVAEQSASNTFEGDTFILTDFLDMGGAEWTPIGSENSKFEGTFDGDYYAIKNLSPYVFSSRPDNVGLFGYIGEKGTVKRLAIAQGSIYLKNKSKLGSIAGTNEGTITHCFNHMRITAEDCDYVGGLVGYNIGTIEYCYNMGVISLARNYVGGLTGCNIGEITDSWAAGFINATGIAGAITGCIEDDNGQTGTFADCFYDQQMTLQKAMGNDNLSGVTAVAQSLDFRFGGAASSYFVNNDNWQTTAYSYPRLIEQNSGGFYQTKNASLLDVSLSFAELGEDNGSVMFANDVNKDFLVDTYEEVEWSSTAPEQYLKIDINQVTIHRPCSNTAVYITASKDGWEKEVCVMLTGFKPFQPGTIQNNKKSPFNLCQGSIFELKSMETKEATFGKDDELKHEQGKDYNPYYYQTELYKIEDTDDDGVADTTLVKTWEYDSEAYEKAAIAFTDDSGLFMFRRYAHDSQCQTEYVRCEGEFYLSLLANFDPGEIETKTDTIYGNLPQQITIKSLNDGEGGKPDYLYRWWENGRIKSDDLGLPYMEAECTITYDKAGVYHIQRSAKDSYCSGTDYFWSDGEQTIVVFEDLTPGILRSEKDTINSCETTIREVISMEEGPTGGTGGYKYQWYSNGTAIDGATSLTLNLEDLQLQEGEEYILTIQVSDSSSFSTWTAAEGELVLRIYHKFETGSISSDNQTICKTERAECVAQVSITESEAAKGDGTIHYRWQLWERQANGNERILLTFNEQQTAIDHFDYTLNMQDWPGINLPATFFFKREVQNELCSNSWIESAGAAVITFGLNQATDETIRPCPTDLPYTYTYKYSDGSEESYTFRKDGEQKIFNDITEVGCSKTHTVDCKIYEYPLAVIPELGSICQDKPTITIPYTLQQGSPTHYRIWFSERMHELGLKDFSAPIESNYQIEVEVGALPMEEHWIAIQFYEAGVSGTCPTPIDTLHFSVSLAGYIYQKWNDILFVDNNDKNGFPNAETDLKFIEYQWFKDGELVEGQTSQIYFEEGGLNGIYYALLTDTEGNVYRSCEKEARPGMGLTATLADDIDNGNATIFTLTGTQLYTMPQQAGIYIIVYPTCTQKVIIY